MSLYAVPPPPLHLGALHRVEQLLVLLLAFGPFVVLAVVVYVVRKRDLADEAAEETTERSEGPPGLPGPGGVSD